MEDTVMIYVNQLLRSRLPLYLLVAFGLGAVAEHFLIAAPRLAKIQAEAISWQTESLRFIALAHVSQTLQAEAERARAQAELEQAQIFLCLMEISLDLEKERNGKSRKPVAPEDWLENKILTTRD